MDGDSSGPRAPEHAPVILDELRAAMLFYRRDPPLLPSTVLRAPTTIEGEPDDRLLDLLDDPFTSVDDTYERLAATEHHLRARSDRRSVFLTVYVQMTDHVRAAIRAGQFTDDAWVRRYLVAFANKYRDALVAFERGDDFDVPPPWQVAFGASLSDRTLLIQDALLGINAHINYDLTYSLTDIAIDPDRAAKLADHDHINDILHRLVDVVQRSLAGVYRAKGYSRLDSLLGSFDEEFTMFGLVEGRTLAWRNAVFLTDTPSALVRRLVHWRIRTVSTGAAHFVLSPTVNPAMLRVLREIEADRLGVAEFRDVFHGRLAESTHGPP